MKGIITDIKADRAIILKQNGTFSEVRNKGYRIGQEIQLASPSIPRPLLIAACFLLVFGISFGGLKAYYTPVDYIYMDINPSLRLDINLFHRVIQVTPLNEDAKFLTAFDTDPGKCVAVIIDECAEKGYLNENNKDIEISIFTRDMAMEQAIKTDCEKYNISGYIVTVRSVNKQEAEDANSRGVSVNYGRKDEKKPSEGLEKPTHEPQAASSTGEPQAPGQTKAPKETKQTPGSQEAGPDKAAKNEKAAQASKDTPAQNPHTDNAPDKAQSNGKSNSSNGKNGDSNGKSNGSNGKDNESNGKSNASNGKNGDSNGKGNASNGKNDESNGKNKSAK